MEDFVGTWTARAAGEWRDPIELVWNGEREERVVLRFRRGWVGFRRDVVGHQPEFLVLREDVALRVAGLITEVVGGRKVL